MLYLLFKKYYYIVSSIKRIINSLNGHVRDLQSIGISQHFTCFTQYHKLLLYENTILVTLWYPVELYGILIYK